MNSLPKIIILCGGGSSSEREVSLLSGDNIYQSCKDVFNVRKIVLNDDRLPEEILQEKNAIIFPITHGEFGEDGRLQSLLENNGFTFVGCDSTSSALCMDKYRAKISVSAAGVPVIDGIKFTQSSISDVIDNLPYPVFIKPNNKGSSVDAHIANTKEDFRNLIKDLSPTTEYLAEKKINGCDMTVGLLDGKALEIVEIHPSSDFFTYDNKYVSGQANEICPAQIGNDLTNSIKRYAEMAYRACKCRDWARADFMLTETGEIYFLEMNTLPGMTNESLFPKSAKAAGIDIVSLFGKLISLAKNRVNS